MRVALVHDWLTGRRGGEKVLEAFCELFPEAPIYTLIHLPGSTSDIIETHPIETAFTQKLPGVRKLYRWYLPLYPWAIESLKLSGYDLVLSSSHCVAKGVLTPEACAHICYCHTPMRYIWDRFHDYFGDGPRSRFIIGPIAERLRRWDVRSAERVDHFVANSHHVAERIRRYYRREPAAIIPPPVDTVFYHPAEVEPEPYYLVVSALAPYKRIDLAIETFRDRPEKLLVAGAGPDEARLRAMAGDNVSFLGWRSDEELRGLYQRCQAFLLPGVEDFGIAPLEAQACGRPVVALAEGGALDSVKDGETGVLFAEPTRESLSRAIDKVSGMRFNKSLLQGWAGGFSRERFRSRIEEFVRARLSVRDARQAQ